MPLDFEQTLRAVPHASTARFGPLLYGLVIAYRPSVVVEVGTLYGYTAAWLARGLASIGSGKLYCIDDFSLDAQAAVAAPGLLVALGFGDYVEFVRGRSQEVEWPDHVDMAFIDGSHSYEGCKADVKMAESRGASVIAIHDTIDWWGPRQLMAELNTGGKFGWDVLNMTTGEGMAILAKHKSKPRVRFSRESCPDGAIYGKREVNSDG